MMEVYMKTKHIVKGLVLFVALAAMLSFVSCDEWIRDTVRVENTCGHDISDVYISYGDDKETISVDILNGASWDFYLSFIEIDKFGEITVHVTDDLSGLHFSSSGNIAENDWLTVVNYDNDF
jgi:hypothetical protein